MLKMKNHSILSILLCSTLSLSVVESSPYTISDERVRGMDITPTLGRGYSIMTNSFLSTCLVVEQTTVPSYNYDYYFTDFTTSESDEVTLGGKISGSFAYGAVVGELGAEMQTTSKVSLKAQMVVATMRLERYYSSLKEDQTPLDDDAITLLAAQDYIGFFKSCGPNYVRGVRRAQELTAIFLFASTSAELSSQVSASLQVTGAGGMASGGAEISASGKFSVAASSLVIKLKGYGLGLNQQGSDSLVTTSMEDYQAVLKYGFQSMTQNEFARDIGMVYGMEVLPWVNNLAFQVNAKILEEVIVVKLPRSMIPKAYLTADGTTEFSMGDTRADYQCRDSSYKFDMFGYCCESQWLYDPTAHAYDGTMDESTAICKPKRDLDKSVAKENMANNGEFVARLDAAMRHRLARIAQLDHCISTSRSFPPSYELNILKPHDTVKLDRVRDITVTLGQLKKAVDPKNDYGMLTHMTKELDEWITMFYSPCVAALYGTNQEDSPSVDESYFMATPWYGHDECMHMACLTNKMRWDRVNGGCVPSLITGTGATDYSGSEDNCSSDLYSTADTEQCKHLNAELSAFHTSATTCWTNVLPSTDVSYLIDHFCHPQLTSSRIDADTYTTFQDSVTQHCS